MMEFNAVKVTKVIRFLEQFEACHDVYDLDDYSITDILFNYGISVSLTDSEQDEVRSFLEGWAESAEISEAVRWANNKYDPIWKGIREMKLPSEKSSKLFRLRWKETMRQREFATRRIQEWRQGHLQDYIDEKISGIHCEVV